MRVVVIGNGLAGTMAAKTLRELDAHVVIDIFAEESHHYYPRPNLIEFLAGRLPQDKIFAFPADWAERQKISLHLKMPVKRIFPEDKEVETACGVREAYDELLLADGSSAFVPPIKGAGKKCVFTLKTLDDAMAIQENLKTRNRVAVLGGGLLGLEAARALKTRGADVEIVEFYDRLLPRQLDPEAAAILRGQIESSGIRIRLGVVTDEILGGETAEGLKFKSGDAMTCGIVIAAAGVRPNLGLAKQAGIETDRGVLVDDRLRTNKAGISAAGDNTQHRGKTYGIIPASFDQARTAAHAILGLDRVYEGTMPSNTLKVAGLFLTSAGLVNPEAGGFEELKKADPEKGVYKKIVLRDGRLKGMIWMGTKKGANEICRAVALESHIGPWKHEILEDDFNYSRL